MDRKQQQAEFIYQVGLVLKPVLDVLAHPQQFDETERARVRARFHIDHQQIHNALSEWCKSEPGAEYASEWHDIEGPGSRINNAVKKFLVSDPAAAASHIEKERQDWIRAILAMPVPVDSMIYDAQTPFSTYCRIRELCSTARKSLFYCDRYVSHTLFHRLLESVPVTTEITLVTWPRAKQKVSVFDEFIDVSKLFAKERPDTYRLLAKADFHDRWLQCDNQLFHLGGSVKDAGDASVFTVSKLPMSPENSQKVHDLVNTAAELFGKTNKTHQ